MLAIITGDIVNSQAVTPDQWLFALKKQLGKYGTEEGIWDIYRGDSFQLKLVDASQALAAAMAIKASIKALPHTDLDVRMAIGVGTQDFTAESVKESSGNAYVYSGTAFEQLKKRTLMIKSPWPEFDSEMNLHFDLAALTINHWSSSSAEAVALALDNPDATQTALAKTLKVSQGNVSDRLKRAGYHEIIQLNTRYRGLVRELSGSII